MPPKLTVSYCTLLSFFLSFVPTFRTQIFHYLASPLPFAMHKSPFNLSKTAKCQVIAGSITAPGFLGALGHNTRSSYHRGYHPMGAPPATTTAASATSAGSTSSTSSSSPAESTAAPPTGRHELFNLTSGNQTNVIDELVCYLESRL
ncbi:uncharacterized protein LOC122320123 [Drosophila ficusphila]|uniref:uncharacterized protein LOC122320123 n=1 Tax=Drosophila ficusphila TaxID=30025 RepID=UPI001C895900|nr:uncharacterized protein LOC122320123 [Drosophila ficusphila]